MFLDIQMPGLGGFDVIDAVGLERMPTVIFVTAFDQFAVRGLIGWRYHHDPIEECRPLSLLQEPVASDPVSN